MDLTRRWFLVGAGAVGGLAVVGVGVHQHFAAIDGGDAAGSGPQGLDGGGAGGSWLRSVSDVDGGGAA